MQPASIAETAPILRALRGERCRAGMSVVASNTRAARRPGPETRSRHRQQRRVEQPDAAARRTARRTRRPRNSARRRRGRPPAARRVAPPPRRRRGRARRGRPPGTPRPTVACCCCCCCCRRRRRRPPSAANDGAAAIRRAATNVLERSRRRAAGDEAASMGMRSTSAGQIARARRGRAPMPGAMEICARRPPTRGGLRAARAYRRRNSLAPKPTPPSARGDSRHRVDEQAFCIGVPVAHSAARRRVLRDSSASTARELDLGPRRARIRISMHYRAGSPPARGARESGKAQ